MDLLDPIKLENLVPPSDVSRARVVLDIPGDITVWLLAVPEYLQDVLIIHTQVVGNMSEGEPPVTAGLHMGLADRDMRITYIREDRTTYITMHGDTVFSYVGPSSELVARELIRALYSFLSQRPL